MPETEVIILPPRRLLRINWSELWRYRDLFIVLAWRDIAVRYKQTVLGVLWAILQPVVTMVVFTIIFNRMAAIESGDGTPYPIFLYAGLLLWQYFSGTLTNAADSMVGHSQLIQKVYFPRLIIPATAATTGLVDLCIASLILPVLMIYYDFTPRLAGLILLPVILLGVISCAMGGGLFLAALNVKYRDVRYALPFFIQTLLYVTPVIYPVKMLDKHATLKTMMLWFNPMAGLIETARVACLTRGAVDYGALAIALAGASGYALIGLLYFRSTERFFADIA